MTDRRNRLRLGARLSLFCTSYTPLFALMIVRQVGKNWGGYRWGGLNPDAFWLYVKQFGFSTVLGVPILFGLVGIRLFILRVGESAAVNGHPVTIKDVENRNSDAIGYIGTYIIPFLFQDYSSLVEITSVAVLLLVIYRIYINSNLLIINPVLNIWYSLYKVMFVDSCGGMEKKGLIITSEKYLQEEDKMLFEDIGQKLYFAVAEREGENDEPAQEAR